MSHPANRNPLVTRTDVSDGEPERDDRCKAHSGDGRQEDALTAAILATAGARHTAARATAPQDTVGELSTRSDDFRRRWGAHNVDARRCGTKHYQHIVGDLDLTYETMDLRSEAGVSMTISTTERGCATARASLSLRGQPPRKTLQSGRVERRLPRRDRDVGALVVYGLLLPRSVTVLSDRGSVG